MTKLIIGLGNPGEKYKQTRHNIGFMAINFINQNLGLSDWQTDKKSHSLSCQGKINNQKIILAKPQTMMNNSGQAAVALVNYYKVNLQNLMIIHDEIDLELGDYKIQKNRGAAGHKGVQSIIDQLATKNFTRLRLGIRTNQTDNLIPVEEFVLQKFSKEEEETAFKAIEKAVRDLRTALMLF